MLKYNNRVGAGKTINNIKPLNCSLVSQKYVSIIYDYSCSKLPSVPLLVGIYNWKNNFVDF